MSTGGFSFDFDKIMDEALKFAEGFRESFDPQKMREGPGCGPFGCGPEGGPFGKGPFPGGPFGRQADFFPSYMYPPANFYLTPDRRLVLEFALAGFEEKDLSVQFRGDSLLFSAKAPPVQDDAGVQYFKHRLKMRDIEEQRYYVPTDRFDQGRAEAAFHDGLLRIVIPPREGPTQDSGIKVNIRTGPSPQ